MPPWQPHGNQGLYPFSIFYYAHAVLCCFRAQFMFSLFEGSLDSRHPLGNDCPYRPYTFLEIKILERGLLDQTTSPAFTLRIQGTQCSLTQSPLLLFSSLYMARLNQGGWVCEKGEFRHKGSLEAPTGKDQLWTRACQGPCARNQGI